MNKKILAAAIAAAAILPMGAQAGVQIYGVIHASIDYVDNSDSGYDGFWNVQSDTSRIGFKGSEDLGNGLKAIWKVEQGVDLAQGGGSWATRNAYIGLAGDWGTFLYGRHDTPLKISTGSLDLFSDRQGDYNMNCPGTNGFGCVGFTDRRQAGAIAYISPNMNGLTFAGAIIPGNNGPFGTNGASDPSGIADGYSLALMYSNNGLYLSAAYENIDDWTGGAFDDAVYRFGAGYDLNAFHIGLIYENEDYSVPGAAAGWDADKWQVSTSYTFGNNVVKAMYQAADVDLGVDYGAGSSQDGTSWAIGFDHNLSKRTTAYVVYADADFGDIPNASLSTADNGLQYYGVNNGSSFAMGMIHKF